MFTALSQTYQGLTMENLQWIKDGCDFASPNSNSLQGTVFGRRPKHTEKEPLEELHGLA